MSSVEAYHRSLAESARDDGERAALAVENRDWADEALDAIERTAVGLAFDADHLHVIVGPPRGSPNAVGSVLTIAARRGWIRRIGYRPSQRPGARGHIVSVWERVDPDR